MNLRAHIINRMRRYNRVNYQYGYITAEECVFGLKELASLAEWGGFYDLYEMLTNKSDKLRELLLEKDKTGFGYKFSEAL